MPEIKGFGRRNPHCSNCGDERGGDFGHEISECKYRFGMTAGQLAETMGPDKAGRYWDYLIDKYFGDKFSETAT